jgi:hypothetical protein
MARRGVPGVVTVGRRSEYPRSTWGWRDWEDEERLQAQLGKEPAGASVVVPPPGPQIASGFTLFPKPNRREDAGARSRAVDRLIQKHVGRST